MCKFFIFILFLTVSLTPAFANPYDINLNWFKNFNDEKLMEYIIEALENNKDAKIARQNILKYRQEKNLKISNEFPNITVGADYSLIKIPKLAIPNNDIQTNSFALPFMTIWEIDYLGKNYNKIQKGRLDIENAMWDVKSANLIVSTDVAGAYFNISNLNKQIEFQAKIKNNFDEILKRKNKMFKSGVITAIELNESENEALKQDIKLADLYKKREIFLTELAYLTGKSPYDLNKITVTEFEKINFTGEFPDTLKGDIILNRPDLMKLDNEMKKAKLDITIAKKDFLPSINVFGIMVFSTIVQNFGWDGVFAALVAGATQNLFDGGRRIFNLKKRKIEYEIAFENYLKSDLNALKEVNDSLYALKKDLEIYNTNKNILEIENSNFIKIFNSYEKGTRNYIEYLEENIRLTNRDTEFLNSKNQNFINLLSLFKASGGAL